MENSKVKVKVKNDAAYGVRQGLSPSLFATD